MYPPSVHTGTTLAIIDFDGNSIFMGNANCSYVIWIKNVGIPSGPAPLL